MEVGYAEAQAGAGLKAAGGRVHADGGWGEGVVGREHEGAPVLAAFVGGFGRAGQDVVPFEDVLLRGVGDDVGWRGFGDGGVLFGEALGCSRCRHGAWLCVGESVGWEGGGGGRCGGGMQPSIRC